MVAVKGFGLAGSDVVLQTLGFFFSGEGQAFGCLLWALLVFSNDMHGSHSMSVSQKIVKALYIHFMKESVGGGRMM